MCDLSENANVNDCRFRGHDCDRDDHASSLRLGAAEHGLLGSVSVNANASESGPHPRGRDYGHGDGPVTVQQLVLAPAQVA